MPKDAERLAPLSVHHAFVVHSLVDTEVTQGRVTGRVEYVASRQSTHFASLEELLTFMGRVLATVRAPPAEAKGRIGGFIGPLSCRSRPGCRQAWKPTPLREGGDEA
jgi:hypothetical protein